MSRTIIVFLTLLLALFSMSSSDARLAPSLPESFTSATTQKDTVVEDSCNGIGKEECLERRTLVAHLDYIYTNDKKP